MFDYICMSKGRSMPGIFFLNPNWEQGETKEMQVVIIGTGYVGLTTGTSLAYLGHNVTCIDINTEKINKLRNGVVPFHEPYLPELLNLAKNNIRFTDSYDDAGIDTCDIVFIAVGTPSKNNGSADMQYVQTAAEQVGQRLNCKFTVVVNKSTVPVGSGNLVNSIIRDKYSHPIIDKDALPFDVLSNPEFLRQGSAVVDTLFPDRIVIGGKNQDAISRLMALYQPLITKDFPIPSFLNEQQNDHSVECVICDQASAELIKYSANAFLALKISYINEIARLASEVGADVQQIARGIGLDRRIGRQFLKAGIGWGGSCFGKDTAALISIGKDHGVEMPIITAARHVNYQQRSWIIDKLLSELNSFEGSTITLLGASFKPNTDDLREAPSIDIANALILLGSTVKITDPVALPNVQKNFPEMRLVYCDDVEDALRDSDAAVLVTEWDAFLHIDWSKVKEVMRNPLILDGRNVLDREALIRQGFQYFGIGR